MNHRPSESESQPRRAGAAAASSAFAVLDDCHRRTLGALAKLAAIVDRIDGDVDVETRCLAADVVRHFSTTAREHHEDEERHVFPKLLAHADAETADKVLMLQQDHHWLEEDWLELEPHLDAIARGQGWCDVAFVREAAAVFAALSRDHIALEEVFIYPEARSRTGPVEAEAMGREMAARRRAARRAAASGHAQR